MSPSPRGATLLHALLLKGLHAVLVRLVYFLLLSSPNSEPDYSIILLVILLNSVSFGEQ